MTTAFHWTSRDPENTLAAGRALGRLATPGLVVALFGSLGAGKTVFVQGLAHGLDVPDWDLVSSPTYTLVARYAGRIPLCHVDAYRLSSSDALCDLGFEEWIDVAGVTAVEWADRAGTLLPGSRLEIRLDHRGPRERDLRAVAPPGSGQDGLLAAFRGALGATS